MLPCEDLLEPSLAFTSQLTKRVIAELSHAKSAAEVLEQRCMGQARERDHLVRTIDSLKATTEETR